MSEETQAPTPEQVHQSHKIMREGLAFAHWRLQTVPFIFEERKSFETALHVLEAMCNDLQQKIEAVEPPAPAVPEEPKKPYVIDVPVPQDPA